MRFQMVVCGVVASLVSTVAFAEQSLESIQKKLSEQTAGIKSLQYASKTTMDNDMGGMKMKMVTDSRYEAVRKPAGKSQFRMESKTKMQQKMADAPEQVQEMSTLSICDGQFMYTINDQAGTKSVMKMNLTSQDPFDTKAGFAELQKQYKIKVLPDETVAGRDTYVLEMTPQAQSPVGMTISRMVSNYDKKTGVPVKTVSYNPAGKLMMTMMISDIKVDADIPADHFVFKAPAGVQVMDMTKAGGAPGTTAPAPAGK